jgi:hypothetical protein
VIRPSILRFSQRLRIEQREAKILGTDAPQQLEVQQHEESSVLIQKELNQAMLANLTIDEKRQLLDLITKASKKNDGSDQ